MPRGRKKITTDPKDVVVAIDQKIADLQEQIGKLKKQRKAAMARQMEQENQKVVDAFVASGKTAEEFLLSVINSQK